MKRKYKLAVKEINNYPGKITVIVTLEVGEYPSLSLPDVVISLNHTEGATPGPYEAEVKEQVKQFLVDVVAGLYEGSEPLPEKCPVTLKARNVWITYKGSLPGRVIGSLKIPPESQS